MTRLLTIAATLLVLGGCDALSPDPPALFRADGDTFSADLTRKTVEAVIPFTFVNSTGRTVRFHGCRPPEAPVLERRFGDAWRTVYAGVHLMCLSPPALYHPGAAFSDTLRVRAGRPGSDVRPLWEAPDVDGTYRLQWRAEVGGRDTALTSAPFNLTAR